MDLNYLLIWIIGFINLLTLLRTARSKHQRGWAWKSALILLVLGVSLAVTPEEAGLIAGGLWGLAIVLPATLVRSFSRALLRQDYRGARKLTHLLRWVVPFQRWDGYLDFIRALELAQRGGFTEAEALFEKIRTGGGQLARSAELQILRLHHRWDEVLSTLTEDVGPDGGAPSRRERLDPQEIVLLLRALGETGRPDELVSTYAHLRPLINSVAMPHALRKSCQLFAFAFGGRREAARTVLEESLRDYPDHVKGFWLATADLTAGRSGEAQERFRALVADSDPLNRKMIEERLARPLPVAEAHLSDRSTGVLDRLGDEVEEEARYEIRSGRSFQKAHATKTFITLNLLVFIVEILAGGSEDFATLLRMGALTPEAVRDGEWWRFVMAFFLHAGPIHLASNMLGLYILGPYVELSLGATRFAVLYLLSGLGSMVYCFVHMMHQSQSPHGTLLVGASGSIMALVGAVGAILLRGWRSDRSILARRKLHLILLIVFVQLTFDYFTRHVSIEAHLSGLVLGFLLAFVLNGRPRA